MACCGRLSRMFVARLFENPGKSIPIVPIPGDNTIAMTFRGDMK